VVEISHLYFFIHIYILSIYIKDLPGKTTTLCVGHGSNMLDTMHGCGTIKYGKEKQMSNKINDMIYEVVYDKHLNEQLKKFKDVGQAEIEAMVLAHKEIEEME
tara:strand:+ start:3094 stop:3402 length:309 start_codon:yes stop_codon:yes gene_type:complete